MDRHYAHYGEYPLYPMADAGYGGVKPQTLPIIITNKTAN